MGQSGIITESYKGKENTTYHDIAALFKIYRAVSWNMQIRINQLNRQIRLEYGTDVDDFLNKIYQAGMDIDTDMENFEPRVEIINRSNQFLKLIDEAVDLVRKFHPHGLYSFGAGLIIVDIIYLYVVMILDGRKSLEKRICRKCGTEFARKLRVCPACGDAYSEADMEKEFSAVIAGENERETEKSPEEINRDYERIEEMNVEAAFALNESDFDEIIREKQQRDDNE